MLDARLKYIVPPVVEAYLEHLQLDHQKSLREHLDTQTALCIILYTLCKVRGAKVIVGFFSNEPRHLVPVLTQLERTLSDGDGEEARTEWQVPYVLLLWLSHLLLTPFDLASISTAQASIDSVEGLDLPSTLPSLASRVLKTGMSYLPTSTKAQDAASTMLVRLTTRPDMQRLCLADALVAAALNRVDYRSTGPPLPVYERLGPLRFLAGIAASADLGHLVPEIYRGCERMSQEEDNSAALSNAVAKKLAVKIFRNIANLSLRLTSAQGPLPNFLETTSVLEDVIDYLLRSLGDRDTPVRFAAAKAISLIVLELEPNMGHEVIQAVLDTLKEAMPGQGSPLDFRTANALRWHGLTLALAHALFKRTASPEQLPDITNALVSALQFEQRTATGSSVGTNVRDAANFGIWSMSRRYVTDELLAVSATALRFGGGLGGQCSVIQALAIQLVLSACLDPAGNIRRGSSAALQELVGRHPNQIHEGIALVQIVDYQAVGLRVRAMVDVANHAADLHDIYWRALLGGLLGWRGLGSADVLSREASAASVGRLNLSQNKTSALTVLESIREHLTQCSSGEAETLHGLVLALACIFEGELASESGFMAGASIDDIWEVVQRLPEYLGTFSPRILRSELPTATARLVTALCRSELRAKNAGAGSARLPFDSIEVLVERLLSRQEDTILQTIPSFVKTVLALKRKAGVLLGGIGAQTLCKKVATDGSKSTLAGAGRAIALGALAGVYEASLSGEKAASAITTLAALTDAMTVDWRIIGVRALELAVKSLGEEQQADSSIVSAILGAVHHGLNDYTIDERGDVGSLVRLQAISCTSSILNNSALRCQGGMFEVLRVDIARLSLEKLDRVRTAAAQCRRQYLGFVTPATDIASVSTYEYFHDNFGPLRAETRDSPLETALLDGGVSCAGVSAEPLLQASRAALIDTLCDVDNALLHTHLSAFAALMRSMLTASGNMHTVLELLGFLLDMQIPQRLAETDFKWRNLLSTVQKSHHKSNDIPKILAAVHVYRGLVGIASVRTEVLKKLGSMLKTNPYPNVRSTVAETLFVITGDEGMRRHNWAAPIAQNEAVVAGLIQRHLAT